MESIGVYSRKDWVRAVNLSGFLGWASVALFFSAILGADTYWDALGFLILAAVFGLPPAFLASWVITAPILKRVMRFRVTWAGAILWGAVISFFIALAGVILDRFLGWLQSLDPNSYSQVGGGDKIVSVDGILTAYGWYQTFETVAVFVGMGVFIALIIRALIGAGTAQVE